MTKPSVFQRCVPEGTFLHHYMQWMSPLETPLAYDFWTGMWVLSSAIGRRLTIPRPGAPVYLNLYLILCADAGVTRKSTAVGRAMEVYYASGLEAERKTVAGSITPEALLQELAYHTKRTGNGEASLVASELVTLLGKEAYSSAMPGILTDLYDCPAQRDVERSGSVVHQLRNVHITMLGASTAAWLSRAINPDVIEGGFTSRCLFVVDEQRKRKTAWPSRDGSGVPAAVQQSLSRIRGLATEYAATGINLHDAAMERFVRWYEQRNDHSNDPFVASFLSREDHHVLRCAALLAANAGSFVVEKRHIEYAIELIGGVRDGAIRLFGGGNAAIRLVSGLDKLRDSLLSGGTAGLTQTELTYKTRATLKSAELRYALELMHEYGMVQRFDISTPGRTKTLWRATSDILKHAMVTKLRDRFIE